VPEQNIAGNGDLDALRMIKSLELNPLLRNFLTDIFNHELDRGAGSNFAYKELYRKLVSQVAPRANLKPEGD